MKTNEELCYEEDSPQLRLFVGSEDSEVDDRVPPDPGGQTPHESVRSDSYWAGRAYAGRRSGRRAA
jgi:hypothetical protein